MTPDRWRQLSDVFDAALDRAPAERAAFLACACADDPDLRSEVERLLASHERAGRLGETPAFRINPTPPPPLLPVGAQLGRYAITGFLGAGGMGEVYRARDPQLDREVGIKILSGQTAAAGDQLARFAREARAVAALNHPNILSIYDIGIQDGLPYVVSELLDGETLRARLKRGPLSPVEALRVVRQIAAGLTAAHDKGIVHRDIKPENLFLTPDSLLKILDFGLAKQTAVSTAAGATEATTLTGEGLIVGTAGYMAPEQVRGQPADARTDVFAVGAVLYEMVTGTRAFIGESAIDTITAILVAEPSGMSALPEPFHGVVARCLEKDRDRRFASMREMAAVLEAGTVTAVPAQRAAPADGRILLAVLPFQNVSGDADQEYFSDGLTDEMIAQLGRLNPQALGVVARTSTIRYKHTSKSIDVIGRELGVAYVLEGSVRRGAERVRITAQLVQVSDQGHVWAQTYEREDGDILALQNDLAGAIAGEIRVQLAPEARARLGRPRVVNPAAYEACLKGRYFWNRRTRESLDKSVRHFQQSIAIDPTHAAAYAGLADAYLTQFDYNHRRPREAFALANDAVREALRLDDTLAEPHSSLAHLRFHQFEFEAAEEEFRRAITLNPGYGTAHYYYANLLAALGRFDEAILEAHRALELDPMNANTRQNRMFIFYLARRYDEALAQVQETLELDPAYSALHYWLGLIYERQGRYDDAIREFEITGSSESRGLTVMAAVAFAHAEAGRRAEAIRLLERLEAEATRAYVSAYDVALVHGALGDEDRACALLDKASDDHASFLPFLGIDARFDRLRDNPRVEALVRQMKLPRRHDVPAPPLRSGRRARPAAVALAIAAAVLSAGLVGAYLWWSRAAEPTAIGSSARPAVAILAFDNPTRDTGLDWLTSGVADMLSIGLAETAGLDVVSSQRTSELLREEGQHEAGGADRATTFDLVKKTGAGVVVAGSVYRSGDDVRLDVRVEDLATARLIAATSVRGPDVFALADEVVGRLRGALRVGGETAGPGIAEITTHSIEAFRLYTEGYAALRGLRTNDARQALEAALRLDPGYALALVALSEAFEKFGDQKRAEEHLARAKTLANRLSERDRLLVEAREAHFAGETDRTVRALEAFTARWPAEDTAWDLLVHAYSRDPALRPRELDVLQRWRAAVPGPGAGHMHNHFGYAYIEAGRLDDAIRSFEAYIRVSPNEPNAYDSYGEALMIAGRLPEAIGSYERAQAIDPLFGASLAGRSWVLAMSGRLDEAVDVVARLEGLGERSGVAWRHVHIIRAFVESRAGRYREAADTIDRGLQLAGRLRSVSLELELRLAGALFAVETAQPLRARSNAVAALALLDRDPDLVEPLLDSQALRSFALYLLGITEVRAGRLAAAERHLEAQRAVGRVDDARQVWWQHALAGELAFHRADLASAERLWRAGVPARKTPFSMRYATSMFTNQLPQRDWEARLLRARGDLAGAAVAYEALNAPLRETPWTSVVEPRFVLERAHVFREMGELERAQAEYRRFLDLWRGADPRLPELAEARRYLRTPAARTGQSISVRPEQLGRLTSAPGPRIATAPPR
jgi:TolB-like protein/Tfp pilus assembly protein PilF